MKTINDWNKIIGSCKFNPADSVSSSTQGEECGLPAGKGRVECHLLMQDFSNLIGKH